jgi:hypothetical protein
MAEIYLITIIYSYRLAYCFLRFLYLLSRSTINFLIELRLNLVLLTLKIVEGGYRFL